MILKLNVDNNNICLYTLTTNLICKITINLNITHFYVRAIPFSKVTQGDWKMICNARLRGNKYFKFVIKEGGTSVVLRFKCADMGGRSKHLNCSGGYPQTFSPPPPPAALKME